MGVRIDHYGPMRDRIYFDCPRRPGHECHVLLKPWPIIGGKTWDWDGNEEAPTLTPSINCNGGPSSCGWHGFIQQGKVTGE
jgi:hypothetical protein